jgi:hypothetical protein
MAQDLSRMAEGSMWPTSGLAGGTAGNDAMTAEGSEPAEPLEGRETPDAPAIESDAYDGRHTQHDGERAQAAARWQNVSPGRRGPR